MNEGLRITPENIKDLLQSESNGSVLLRPASSQDIPSLVRLLNAAYLYENEGETAFKTPEAVRTNSEEVEQEMIEGIVIVAANPQKPQEILGCIQYKEIAGQTQDKMYGYFGGFAVDPDVQSKGIGGKLMRLAEGIAEKRGMDTMQIQVINHSTHLLSWYSSKGYAETSRVDWHAPFLTKPTHFVIMQKGLRGQ